MPLFAAIVVLAVFYLAFKLGDEARRRKAADVKDVWLLSHGAARRELIWAVRTDQSSQAIARLASILQGHGARILRREESQAILEFGSRTGARMQGLWACQPLEAPTRVLVQVRTADGAHSLRVRFDEDYGFQMFMGPMKRSFDELYGKSFDALTAILDGTLGPHGLTSQ